MVCWEHGRSSPQGVNGTEAEAAVIGAMDGPALGIIAVGVGGGAVSAVGATVGAAVDAWSATSQPFAAMQSLKSALA